MNKSKKIISAVALTLALSAFALTGCKSQDYKGDTLSAQDNSKVIESTNGGFSVETEDYVYFINGVETNSADNTYGTPKKGALLRISKANLASGKYGETETVVPSLFVVGNYDSGIYIYDGYVYYATPTTDDNNEGQVQNTYLDFKRAKLDGKEAPMGGKDEYFFRLSSNTTKYRYVKEGDTVYCLYEQDGKLKSYNTKTGTTTILVSGASGFAYDKDNLASGNVYYTMSVSYDLDKDNVNAQTYNQMYCVNAAATAITHSDTASYTVMLGDKEIASYDFDEAFMKENEEEKGYDLGDYTTYPYVNLGQLVLDGVGYYTTDAYDGRFNVDFDGTAKDDASLNPEKQSGYYYTIQAQDNNGVYFTRREATESDGGNLYYLANDKGEGWNTVAGNKKADLISTNTTNASASAVYEVLADGHSYIYRADTIIKKATVKNGATETIDLVRGVATDITLWKTEGDYLYYYGTGANGKNITRVNYKGDADSYNELLKTDEYKPQTLALVDFSDSWYKPEFVKAGDKTVILYPNAQSFGNGGTAYNYIYASELGTTAEIIADNDAVKAVNDFIDEYADNSQIQNVMKYHFRTQATKAYDDVKDLYSKEQKTYFEEFQAEFAKENGFKYENEFISLVGKMKNEDSESIEKDWASYLLQEDEVAEESEGLPDWAIWLIVVGSVAVVGGVVAIILVNNAKKKKAEAARQQAIVEAYKHKNIDTTDDKSIDVYADDEAEEVATEEGAEEVVEPTEEALEEVKADEETPDAE